MVSSDKQDGLQSRLMNLMMGSVLVVPSNRYGSTLGETLVVTGTNEVDSTYF
jgi:hypothetical protein